MAMADPTPPAAPADPSSTLAALSSDDRATWRQTGKLPESTPAEVPSGDEDEAGDDEAPAGAPASATPPASAAATEPAKAKPVAQISNRQKHLNELTRRAAQAEIERDEARAALARLGQTGQREPAQPPAKAVDPNDPEPAFDQFLDQPDPYLALVRATAAWDRRQEARAEATQRQQQTAAHAAQTQMASFIERSQAHHAAHPEFLEKTAALRQAIHPQSFIGQTVLESAVGPQLLDYLADHPTEFDRIARQLPPDQALRALGKIEASLEPPSSAPAAAVLSPKTVTSAPPPPTTLGTRPADPADAEAGAVARGDFRAFQQAANRRDEARARTR